MQVIKMEPEHAAAVLEIYRQGMQTGIATFETIVPSWAKFDNKFLPHSRFVANDDEIIAGWAVIAPTSPRECYKGVAEVSIFIHENYRGKGVGKMLMEKLIASSEENGIWTLQSLIHSDNPASIHLHELFGFRLIGYRERIAQLNGIWKTNVLMERRSKITGI